MKIFLLIIGLVLLTGCNSFQKMSRSVTPEINKDYVFSYVDKPQDKKISLELESNSGSSVCMTNSTWPSDQGQLDGATHRVFIIVKGKKYSYRNYEMNYCPFRECAVKAEKGERIKAEIFYKDFDLPETLYNESKQLILDVAPFWCDQGKWMD